MGYVWTLEQIKKIGSLRAKGEASPKYEEDVQAAPELTMAKAAEELRSAFVEECRTSAVEVSPLDVMITWGTGDERVDYGEPDSDDKLQPSTCVAQWYPNRPVLLRGGPGEGKILRPNGHPLTPGVIAFNVARAATEDDDPAEMLQADNTGKRVVVTATVPYVLAGWDEDERMWIFSPATEGDA